MTDLSVPGRLAVVVVAVGLILGPVAATGAGTAAEDAGADRPDPAASLGNGSVLPQTDNLTEQRRAAVDEGVAAGIELAREQGANVTAEAAEEARESARDVAVAYPNASLDQLRAAATGASHGAFIQGGGATLEQRRAALGGSVVGGLERFAAANATQLRNAAYGAAHGAVAQHLRANATLLRAAARGGAGGAASYAAQTGSANVSQIREAAQGSTYGALETDAGASVDVVEAAASGAAGGLVYAGDADPKQVQAATMGAARGAVRGSENATGDQISAAARGAAGGALIRHRNTTVVQLQLVASGAARGALGGAETATAAQIEAAARGAARGTLVQVQRIDVVQVQYAAFGAASGAARTAGDRSIDDYGKVEAAAAGAGSGAIVQIQQISVIQIRIVAEGAASGALSGYQGASIVQIRSAARGASEGTLTLSQRQRVTVERSQQVSERVAATTVRTVVQIEITNDVTIYNYAKGIVGADGADGEEEADLRSLFFSAEDGTAFLANPNDVSVTVTVTSDGEGVRTVTLAAGESTTIDLESGSYTFTAETAAGDAVRIVGRTEISVSVGQELRSVEATVEDGELVATNPNDEGVAVTVRRDGAHVLTFFTPAHDERRWELAPGTYSLTAETPDDRPVAVNGRQRASVTVEGGPVSLGLAVDGQNVTVENPSDVDVTVTATDEAGEEREFEVPAGESVTESFEPGTYTLAGEAAEDRDVLIDGEATAEVTVEPRPALDLNVTVENGTVTVTNPGDVNATFTASPAEGVEGTLAVAAGSSASVTLDPGNYTLTATAEDGRNVTLDGRSEFAVAVAAPPPEPIDLDVAVMDGNVTVANPGAVDVTVDATAPDAANVTIEVAAGENVTRTLEPGNYTLTASAADDRQVTLDSEDSLSVTIRAPEVPRELASCQVVDAAGRYVLAGDVQVATGETCLDVRASDVVVAGQDGLIERTGTPTEADVDDPVGGVLVSRPDETSVENVTVRNVTVRGWRVGVTVGPRSNATLRNATVRNSTDDGVLVDGNATVVGGLLAGNGGLALDARTGNATAAELQVGEVASLDFANESVGVGSVNRSALPSLPENATAVGPGLEVTGGPDSVAAGFAVPDDADGAPELWLHDGANWSVAATGDAIADGRLGATIDQSGTYAVVAVAETEPAAGVNATVGNDAVRIENPTDAPVVATVTTAGGETLPTSVPSGANVSVTRLDPGNFTLTATTVDGESVPVNGAADFPFTLPPVLETLSLSADGNLSVANPNEVAATVTVENETGDVAATSVPGGDAVTLTGEELAPGTYTVSATTADGRRVPVDGEWNATISVEASEEPVGPEEATSPTEAATSTPTASPTATATPTETETTSTPTETEATSTPTATETTAEPPLNGTPG